MKTNTNRKQKNLKRKIIKENEKNVRNDQKKKNKKKKTKWKSNASNNANESKSNRSPQSASWASTDKNLSPARALYIGIVCDSITMALYEVRARHGPSMAWGKLQWFSHFLVSRPFCYGIKKKKKKRTPPPRAFCLCGILKTNIYFIRNKISKI